MSEYRLKIVTPDRLVFDSAAERTLARTVNGDVCILARHTEYIAPLAIGAVKVKANGNWRTASCSGGTLVVTKGEVTI
ncbi:MAG: F0F1 ATP synthase subunit epsilon, partial [Clostridia bacterium]|nr:F0F1 ATP synthase subunit epsilon [Clostridia bacterium]